MKVKKSGLNYIFFIILALSVYIPFFEVGVRVRVEDIAVLLFLFILPFTINEREVSIIFSLVYPLLIFIVMFIPLGVMQSKAHLGEYILPTELWQYIKRLVFFSVGFNCFYSLNEKKRTSISKSMLIIVFGLLIVGLLQVFPNNLGDYLTALYPRSDTQFEIAMADVNRRIYGVSGHSISWGGFSGFLLLAGLFLLFTSNVQLKSYFFIASLLFILSFLNVFFSGSRAALAAYIISLVVLSFFVLAQNPKWILKSGFFSFILLSIVVFFGTFLFSDQISFIIYRFDVLIEQSGGQRMEQINMAVSLLNEPYDILIGVSNSAQRANGVTHGVEVEPVNLYANYGVIGVLCIYGFLALLLTKLYKLTRETKERIVFYLMFSMFTMYSIFSLGYFFFAEIVVGAYPFLIFGMMLGFTKSKKDCLCFSSFRTGY
ncbi:O-antigen ligase family protein [Vibrio sp. RE86]|uniref:O-antigen ligase family protein n=1 Tax=Vibrio sp. RE86 TaxID=2607605 RepID=UPI001493CADF|nr:O-antigen ligase family protein [Vibrio sp. RE86]NOH80817.1 O-antigen ligase family protein [Vibrio sp. RE86]